MEKRLFFVGVLVIVLAFGMTVIGCNNDTSSNVKTIDSKLIGKWEFEKVLVSGIQYSFPYAGVNSGGYVFTSDSFTSYVNGNIAFTYPGMYTENNKLYTQDGQAGYSYSISGNKLTATAIDGSSGVIANKVDVFSWELQF